MARPLITKTHLAQLIANGARSAKGEDIDPRPVVKLFTPDAGATWLLTEADPDEPDRVFGLCDLGLGHPELGYASLAEIQSVRGRLRLPVERDLHFTAKHPLSWYTTRANQTGRSMSSTNAPTQRLAPERGAFSAVSFSLAHIKRRSGCSHLPGHA